MVISYDFIPFYSHSAKLASFKKFAFEMEFDRFLSCFDKTLEIIGMILNLIHIFVKICLQIGRRSI